MASCALHLAPAYASRPTVPHRRGPGDRHRRRTSTRPGHLQLDGRHHGGRDEQRSRPPALGQYAASASFTFSAATPAASASPPRVPPRRRPVRALASPQAYADSPTAPILRGAGDRPAGNVDQTPASFSWTIDTTAPTTSIDSGPSGLTNDPTPTFTFSSEPGVSFECSIDKGTPNFGSCSGANSHTPDAPLADGPYTFRVRATDNAGNPGIATQSFTLDTAAPPAPQLTATIPASPANQNSPKVIGSAPAGSTVRLYTTIDCWGRRSRP